MPVPVPIIESPSRKLLILDIDETLIYASMFRLPMQPQFRLGLAEAVARPGLAPFLRHCFAWFRVAVWTSATEAYAADALGHILPDNLWPEFVWCRGKCYRTTDPASQDTFWVKDMDCLRERGQPLGEVLVIDDEPRGWVGHSEHVLAVPKFRGEPSDKVLANLLPVLAEAAATPDLATFLRQRAAATGSGTAAPARPA